MSYCTKCGKQNTYDEGNNDAKFCSSCGEPLKDTEKNYKREEEKFEVRGEELLKKIKELIHEGNIRKITIKTKDGKTLAVFPLTAGVVGAVIAPVLAAVGVIAALVSECTILIERETNK